MDKERTGKLEIYREHRLWAMQRSYAIIVDGEKSGSVKDDNTTLIPLNQGAHAVAVKFGWKKSNTIRIDIEPDKTTKLNIGYKKLKGWKLLAISGVYIAMVFVGAAIAPILLGIGVVGFMFNRVGRMYLYKEQQT